LEIIKEQKRKGNFMNYIGSKLSLLEFLENSINKVVDKKSQVFVICLLVLNCRRYFKKKGYKIIANDIQYYSYVLNRHYIENHKELFSQNLQKKFLN